MLEQIWVVGPHAMQGYHHVQVGHGFVVGGGEVDHHVLLLPHTQELRKYFTCELEFGFENCTKSSPYANVARADQMQGIIMMCLNPGIFLTVQYIVLRELLLSVHRFTSPRIQSLNSDMSDIF